MGPFEIFVQIESKYSTITAWLPHQYKCGDLLTCSGKLWVVIGISERTITLERVSWLRRLWWWIRAKFRYEVA